MVGACALTFPLGVSLWNEQIMFDLLHTLDVRPAVLPKSDPLDSGDWYDALLVIPFTAQDPDRTRVVNCLEGDNFVFDYEVSLKEFDSRESDVYPVLAHPYDVLDQWGLCATEGDDMGYDGLLSLPAVQSVDLVVQRAPTDPPLPSVFRCRCAARLPDGTEYAGVLETITPALYVSVLKSRCEKWAATLSVAYKS